MESRLKNHILCKMMLVYIIAMCVILLVRKTNEYSDSERRLLAQKPEFTVETFIDGDYGGKYEDYLLDQFPMRDNLRTIKVINEKYVFGKKDYNGIILENGYLSKIEYPMRKSMLDYASERFEYIYKKYLKKNDIKPYMVIVPDKNYYIGQKNNILTMNYSELYEYMLDGTPYMKNIDIRKYLDINDYYCTDTHWRQEKIEDIARFIGRKMGAKVNTKYDKKIVKEPFYGVYASQAALAIKPDELIYLTNDTLKNCIVKCYDTGSPVKKEVYDMEKLKSKDMYEMFLSGAVALTTIDNPVSSTKKELIMFRDSFGSSLAPLLVEGYSKITLVDIRYIRSDMLEAFIEFNNQDVLFIYSTLLLNSSMGMK